MWPGKGRCSITSEKDDIEPSYKRLFRLAEVPLNSFYTVAFQIGKVPGNKIGDTGTSSRASYEPTVRRRHPIHPSGEQCQAQKRLMSLSKRER
jgi:hypothetical protein